VIDVTVLFLNETFSSTAVGPMEVFRHAGSLWNLLAGKQQNPRFRVTTASANGKAVDCDGFIQIKPNAAINDIRKADLIFIPTTGLPGTRRVDQHCLGALHCDVVSAEFLH